MRELAADERPLRVAFRSVIEPGEQRTVDRVLRRRFADAYSRLAARPTAGPFVGRWSFWESEGLWGMTFADELSGWTDWDGAAFELGRTLGLFTGQGFREVKYVFWTSNALGDGLHDALLALTAAGVLDRRDEPDEQFRWHNGTI